MSTGKRTGVDTMRKGDHPLIRSAVVMRETLRLPTMFNMLTSQAKKLVTTKPDKRSETSSEAPIVVVNDLSKGMGSNVEIFLHHDISGKPIMGTANAEGKGSHRTRSSFEIGIDRYTKGVKDGDAYDVQERTYELKGFNRSDLGRYYRQLDDQLLLTHLAGARGHYQAKDMHVPLETDIDFERIAVNPVTPPTGYTGGDGGDSRHFFVGSKDSISGGSSPLTSTDKLTVQDFREWKSRVEEMPNPPEPIDLSPEDDPYRYDPLYATFISPRGWADLAADAGTSGFKELQALAIQRGKMMGGGPDGMAMHPLFKGDCMLIDGVLVRKMPYPIRFLPGQKVRVADPTKKKLTITEQLVGASETFCVERGLWVGGQAIAMAFGNPAAKAKTPSGGKAQAVNFRFLESKSDFDRKSEQAIEWVKGVGKICFESEEGIDIDRGVIAFDYATKL